MLWLCLMSMFPTKYLPCLGSWTLASTTDRSIFRGTDLFVDYNAVELSVPRRRGMISYTHTCYGSLVLSEDSTNVVWLKLTDVDVDVGLLPRIQIPYPTKLHRMRLEHTMDETGTFLKVITEDHEYLFRKAIPKRKEGDTVVKIFFTQLVFDYIIRHLR